VDAGNAAASYQVVQEFLNVAPVKLATPISEQSARRYLATVFRNLHIVSPSFGLISDAMDIRLRCRISWYDSLIVAAALEAKCSVLYSEDFQHGMRFGDLKVQPRRRNLWVTDMLQWAPEARLAQPANPMWDSAASAFSCS